MATKSDEVLVSVIVCTYERAELLGRCLEAANRQSLKRANYEILVVENSKSEEIYEAKKKLFAESCDRFIRSSPPGLSRARNLGMHEARGKIVVYLDDDAIPEKKWLQSIVSAFDLEPNIVCVGGKVAPLYEAEPPHWLTQELLNYLSVVDYGDQSMVLPTDKWIVGANMAFNRQYIVDFGGFPEHLGRVGNTTSLLSNDETPIFDQIRADGLKVIYSGQAKVRHLVPKERMDKEWFRRRVIWQALSDIMKGEKLSEAEKTNIKSRYAALISTKPLHGRSLFGLLSTQQQKEIFPGQFSDELGFLYSCTRYLAECGATI